MGNPFLRKLGLLFSAIVLTAGMVVAQQTETGNPAQQPESGNSAQQPETGSSTQPSQTTMKHKMSDEAFAKKAAEGGMAEVKLGQLAQEKGHSEAVKNFGQRMAEDHGKANKELESAASQANISLPQDMSSKDQASYARLSKLSGPAFDHAYARLMLKDHEHDVAAFRHEAKNGENEPIKSFASNTLPVLEQHLAMARQMNQEVHPGMKGHQGNTGDTMGTTPGGNSR